MDVIEAGFPISSQGDFDAVKTIAKAITRSKVAALARANTQDIDRAWEAIKGAKSPLLHTFISTSDIHLKHQLMKSKEEVIRIAAKSVARAKKHTSDVEFSAMDATRSEIKFLAAVVEAAIQAGATRINIPDTVGYAIPTEFGALIRTLCQMVKGIAEGHAERSLPQ